MNNLPEMNVPLKGLLLEDSELDAGLIRGNLSANFPHDFTLAVLAKREVFLHALSENHYDFILSDFHLPDFDGFSALKMTQTLSPFTPFIIVSGTIGEETAAELLKQGATDYVLKDRLGRLSFAIERALKEGKDQTARLRAIGETQTMQMLLKASLESPKDMIILAIDHNFRYLFFNQAHKDVMKHAYGKEVEIGMSLLDCVTSEIDKVNAKSNYGLAMSGVPHSTIQEYGDIAKNYYESFYNPLFDNDRQIVGATVFARDITERITQQNQLREAKERFETMFSTSPDIAIISRLSDGQVLDVNEGFTNVSGYSKEEVIGKSTLGLNLYQNPADRQAIVEELKKQGFVLNKEVTFRRKDASNFRGLISSKIITVDGLSCVSSNIRDITERKRAEEALRISEEKYRLLYSSMKEGLALHEIVQDTEGKVVDYRFMDVNPSFEAMTGLKREAILGKTVLEVLPKTESFWIERYGYTALTGEPAHFESYAKALNRYYGISAYSPQKGQFAVVVSDITERVKREEEIRFLSYHDQLTGLHNRRFYEEELIRVDIPANLPITIIMADINGLKLINDSFGHVAGDNLLKTVASIFRKSSREQDCIARIGGDEFVFVLPKAGEAEATAMINEIKNKIIGDHTNQLKISAAFGFETKSKKDQDIQEVFQGAENHMYRHKLAENTSMRSKTIDLIMNTLFEKNPREMRHSQRVSAISEKIAIYLGLPASDIHDLKIAGLMHDIGKIGIEETVLNKSGKLTADEWNQIKKHPEVGYRILSSSNDFSDIADCILEHHEHWDGSGYPKGLQGENILLNSRIIAIADAFDAMTTERTYRKKMSETEAFREIKKCSGTQFDPAIAQIFLRNFTE